MTLEQFFQDNPKCAIAFSGGVDSAYLLWAAIRCGARVKAYFVKTAFQPQFELDDALRLAKEMGADMTVLNADVLENKTVAANPADRCYHCKRMIFGRLLAAAQADGFSLVLDGTNASDDASDRPGMRALAEMQVRSPLRECGLRKEQIRRLSAQAGLFTWDKPAYACLATRIPTGEPITAPKLERTERAEAFLSELGFRDFRVRTLGDGAKLQLREADLPRAIELREKLLAGLKQDYSTVVLDLEVRRGETPDTRVPSDPTPAEVVELCCNLDDMTGEAVGFAMERLLNAGALEVYTVPIGMKKSRPGIKLCVLCRPEQREDMVRQMLMHTTTLGVREACYCRHTLRREFHSEQTSLGTVTRKDSVGSGIFRSKYEYEDLAQIARQEGMSLQQVRHAIECRSAGSEDPAGQIS